MDVALYQKGALLLGTESNYPMVRKEALHSLRQLDGYRCPACGREAKGLSGYEGKIAHFMWRCTNSNCGLQFRSRDINLKENIWENPLVAFEDQAFKTLCSHYLEYKKKVELPDGE